MTNQETLFLKAIKKETEASYSDAIEAMKLYGLDREAVINYLREKAVVYA